MSVRKKIVAVIDGILQLGHTGVKLRSNAGVFEARNAANNAFVSVKALDISVGSASALKIEESGTKITTNATAVIIDNAGTPVELGKAATAYVGEIRDFQNAIPTNWLEQDASSISLTSYTKLATYLGHAMVAVAGVYPLNAGVAFTTDFATDNRLDAVGHGLVDNDRIKVSTSDTLPAGLAANVFYYVKKISNDEIEVALTAGGATVVLTSDGVGTHKFHAKFTLADSQDRGLKGWVAGDTLGAVQADQMQGHRHQASACSEKGELGGTLVGRAWTGANLVDTVAGPVSDGTNGTPRQGLITRGKSLIVKHCICWEGVQE